MHLFFSIFFQLFILSVASFIFYFKIVKYIRILLKTRRLKRNIYKIDVKTLNREIEEYVNVINKEEVTGSYVIFRKFLYIKIISRDIGVLLDMYDSQKSTDAKNIIARTLALQLFEFYNDINNLFDKEFENDFIEMIMDDMLETFKTIKKLNSMMKTQHYERLKEIRTNIIAHRDFDVIKQYTLIKHLDAKEIIDISKAVMFMIYWFNLFHASFTAKLFVKIGVDVDKIKEFDIPKKDIEDWNYLLSKLPK